MSDNEGFSYEAHVKAAWASIDKYGTMLPYIATVNPEAASAYATRSHELSSHDSPVASRNLALSALNQARVAYFEKRDEDELIYLNRSIDHDPNIRMVHVDRGICHVKINNFDEAINDFNYAEDLMKSELDAIWGRADTTKASIHHWRGLAYYFKKDYLAARDDFTKAISYDAASYSYHMRALASQMLNSHGDAIEDFGTTLRLEPNPSARIFRARAFSYARLENLEASVQDLNKVIALEPTATDYSDRGWKFLRLKAFDKALSDFETAIKQGDKASYAYNGRGDAYFHLAEFKSALADYNETIKLRPDDPYSYLYRGDCYLKLKNKMAADQDFVQAAVLFRKQNKPEKAYQASRRVFGN